MVGSATQWAKTYHAGGAEVGYVLPISTSSDYYLLGQSTSETGDQNCLFGKLDPHGSVRWAKSIGGAKKDSLDVVPVSDGYLVHGTSQSFNDGIDTKNKLVWAKFTKQWAQQHAYRYGKSLQEHGGTFAKTSDGGLLFYGSRTVPGANPNLNDQDILIIKIRPNGGIAWKKTLNYTLHDTLSSMVEVRDGYVFSGVVGDIITSNGLLLMKLNKSGNIVFKNLYSIDIAKTFDRIGMGGNLLKLADGNLMLTGRIQQLNPLLGGDRTLAAKLSPGGALLWDTTYGSANLSQVAALQIIENPANKTLLFGGTISHKAAIGTLPNSSLVALKTDKNGRILLQNAYGTSTEHNTGRLLGSVNALYFSGQHSTRVDDPDWKTLYGKLDATTLTPIWGRTFGGAGANLGILLRTPTEAAPNFLVSGTTLDFGYSTAKKGDIFGLTPDVDGNYAGCTYLQPYTPLPGSPDLLETPIELQTSTPDLQVLTPSSASSIILPVIDTSIATTDICPSIP
jgi:hypothetical protein